METEAGAPAELKAGPIPRGEQEVYPAAPPVPKGREIYAAIDKVEIIVRDLKEVLNDMEMVMEYLEDIERQQITDDREIETLRSRLESLHRRVDRSPQPQRHEPRHHHSPKPSQEEEAPEPEST